MGEAVTIQSRVMPTVKTVPLAAFSAARVEVLPTFRKFGTVLLVPEPSRGRGYHECRRRGYC